MKDMGYIEGLRMLVGSGGSQVSVVCVISGMNVPKE